MKAKFVIILLLLQSNTPFKVLAQLSVTDTSVINKKIKLIGLPEEFEASFMHHFRDVDSADVVSRFGQYSEHRNLYAIYYNYKGVLPGRISWYEIEDSIYLDEYDLLLIEKLKSSKFDRVDTARVALDLEFNVVGITNVRFENSVSGSYDDEVYDTLNVDFRIRPILIANWNSSPMIFPDRGNYISKNALKYSDKPNVYLQITFNSIPKVHRAFKEDPFNLNQSRVVYFNPDNMQIESSEIRSRFNHLRIDKWMFDE